MASAKFALIAALLLAGTVSSPDQVRADAALAVGQPVDVARQGIALGWAVDYAGREAAEKEALARCRGFSGAPQTARDLCRIVESVSETCLAVAFDAEPGTTGVGWGVHRNREWAEDAAMEMCAGTSAPKRRESCRVAVTRCDGR